MTTPTHVRDHVYGIVAHPTMSAAQKADMLKRVSDATTAVQRATPAAYPAIAANAYGATTPGNIDLANRPYVHNADGSVSTVRSMGANIDGREVLMPTVSPDGRIMGDREAVNEYLRTGKHLGIYPTAAASDAAGQAIHEDQMRAPPRDVLTGVQPPAQFPGPTAAPNALVGLLGAPAATPAFSTAPAATPAPTSSMSDEIDRQQASALAALAQPTAYPTTKAPAL